jgi:hypothetical protein
MKDEYLWDCTGEPDPDIARLENTLGRVRFDRPAPQMPARVRHLRLWSLGLAAAACLALTAGVWWFRQPPANAIWKIGSGENARALAVGEWLTTDAASSLRLSAWRIGHVDLQPNSRLRLKTTRKTEQRLELAQGKIDAFITAPPRLFFVETPSAVAADLGCAYSLEVDADGNGFLHVTYGWVELADHGRTSLVPSDAQCRTRKGLGPGTPHFPDATGTLRAALEKLDFEHGGAAALGTVLAEARQRDSLTLWNLLARVSGEDRAQVYQRLAALVAPPKGVTREAVLRLEAGALDEWKDELKRHW